MPYSRFVLTLLLLSCSLGAIATAPCKLWAVDDGAGQGWLQCGTRLPGTISNMTVCVDNTSIRPGITRLLVRSSPEVQRPIRIHSVGCELGPLPVGSGDFSAHCKDQFFNHSVVLADPAASTSDPLPIGRLLLPTAWYRPGGVVRGLAFIREQANLYTRSLRVFEPTELEVVSLALQDPRGQDVAVFDIASPTMLESAVLLQFEVPISPFWSPGVYTMILQHGRMSVDAVPITIGHHVKHAIRVTVEADEWALPNSAVNINVSAEYLFGAPLGPAQATITSGTGDPVHITLTAGRGQGSAVVGPNGTHAVLVAVVDASGRTGEAEDSIEVVASEYRAAFGSLPAFVHPNATLTLRIAASHRRTSMPLADATVNVAVTKQTAAVGGGYAAVCKDVCASVSICAKFDREPELCAKQVGCSYGLAHSLHREWCDPAACVECENVARKPWSHNVTTEAWSFEKGSLGDWSLDLPFAGMGEYSVVAELRRDGNLIGAEKWTVKVIETTDAGSGAPQAGRGSDGAPSTQSSIQRAAPPGPPQLKLANLRAENGILFGEMYLENAHGNRKVFVDAYAFNGSASNEVFIDGAANFSLPLDSLDVQTWRVDAYLDPLPSSSSQAFFSQPGDYEHYSEAGVMETYEHGAALASSTVFVGRPRCAATVLPRNVSLFTGSILEVEVEVSPACIGGHASLLLVDEGVPAAPPVADLDVPQPVSAASTYIGRTMPREDVAVSTGIEPSCVTSLPAVITISGWGLSDGLSPPNISVGGKPCPVVEMRRVFVQHSATSSRGKWVRWVSCLAEAAGRVDMRVQGKRFECVGQCNLEHNIWLGCSTGDVRGQQAQLCARWMHHDATCGTAGYGSNKNIFDGPVIGIDLGTTSSCVGIYKNGRVEIIPNAQGKRVTPSYIAFLDNETLVGEAARSNIALAGPGQTLFDMKRLIGRDFDDAMVQEHLSMLPFEVVDQEGKPMIRVKINGTVVLKSPEQLSSLVLAQLKETAEDYLGKVVTQAVITVPAYFNDAQRQATKKAGELAGLNVLRIINEPTAAAIAYGLDKKSEQNILVYDLGGGTFDVSLLGIDNGVFEFLSTSGDAHLGGEDFDQRVMQHFIEVFNTKHNKNMSTDKRALQKLRHEVEKSTRALSSKPVAHLEIDWLFDGVDFAETLTRARFEDLNKDLFLKTLGPLEQVLKDSGVTKSQINEIVLVGGSASIPKVQQLLKNFLLGVKPDEVVTSTLMNLKNFVLGTNPVAKSNNPSERINRGINPDEVVAYGAAVQAGLLSGEGGQDLLLLDVTPLSLGVALRNNTMQTVMHRNSIIPSKKTLSVSADLLPQGSVYGSCLILVYEGEFPKAARNHFLGSFTFSPCDATLDIQFEIDTNGILSVGAEDKSSGKSEMITISNDQDRLTEEQIEQMIKAAEADASGDAHDELGGGRADMDNHAEEPNKIDTVVRNDFRESIVLAPVIINERLTSLNVTMPDAVTSWAVKVVVATESDLAQASGKSPVVVVNPIFSQTVTPPFMTLHDDIYVSTIVENTLQDWLRDVSVQAQHDQTLDVRCHNCSADLVWKLGDLAPGHHTTVWWQVRAMHVGQAVFNTSVRVGKPAFHEDSTLQMPLRIGPPGTPKVEASRSIVRRGESLVVDTEITNADVHAEAHINFLVGSDAAQMALEGVDSLATYPYGCCEQTVAATFPNLVALQYLDARGDKARRPELLHNLRVGRDRLVNIFMQPSGGFAMWPGSGQAPTTLHTSMAVGLLGAMKDVVDVAPSVLGNATACLRRMQQSDGAYPHSYGLSSTAVTAYVLHAQALAGQHDHAAFAHLSQQAQTLDAAALALTTRAALLLKLGSNEDREGLVTRLRSMQLCTNSTGTCHWPRGGAMSSSVETTAYAISALSLARSAYSDIDPALRWLLAERRTDGWQTTIDTLWAAYALAEVIKMPAASNGSLSVTIDGVEVGHVDVSPATQRKAAAESRSMRFALPRGTHRIEVAWAGEGEGHCVTEVHRWQPSVAPQWVHIDQSATQQRTGMLRGGVPRWSVDLSATLAPNVSDWRYREAHTDVMVEVPIPAGATLLDHSFHSLRALPFVQHVEVNDKGDRPVIGLFIGDLTQERKLIVAFGGSGNSSFHVGGVRVLPMYQPEHTVVANMKLMRLAEIGLQLGKVSI